MLWKTYKMIYQEHSQLNTCLKNHKITVSENVSLIFSFDVIKAKSFHEFGKQEILHNLLAYLIWTFKKFNIKIRTSDFDSFDI